MGPMQPIERGSVCWLGTDVVEVLEVRDRGYVLARGPHGESLVPVAHLTLLTADELAELDGPDDADSLTQAALELAHRVAVVRATEGADFVAAIPVVGGVLAELDAIATLDLGEGDDVELEPLDLPPPGPGAGVRATGQFPGPQLVPQQATAGAVGVATATPVSRSTTASVSPPVARPEAQAPLVNGAPPAAKPAGPPKVTVTPAKPRPGEAGPIAVATAGPPVRREDEHGGVS